jgi:AbiJ N-terminal domain 4
MIFETFAYRKKLESRNGQPDVYTYDDAPKHLRHQICLALREGIGRFHRYSGNEFNHVNEANEMWSEIDRICTKEIESYLSYPAHGGDLDKKFLNYVMNVTDIDDFLSAVEIGCIALTVYFDKPHAQRGARESSREALKEINKRFEQHAVGYQFENRQIIRVDSRVAHAEIVKPALQLLSASMFAKANEEFFSAHRQYRAGAFKDCVTGANRAFESALKAICDTEGWTYDKGDRASELVTKVTNNGLFTHAFDKSLSAYVAMLKTGLPSVRNDAGGHGEGIAIVAVTAEIARFALNLTASNILFLGDSYRALKAR